MRILLTILITAALLPTTLKAQFVTDYQRVADLYFQNKEYFAAAEYYKKALNVTGDSLELSKPYAFENKQRKTRKKSEDEQIVYKLAESYRLYKDFASSEKWYGIAKEFSDSKYILSNFYYAEALRANKKYDDAIIAFQKFIKVYNKDDSYTKEANIEIAGCRLALREMRYPRLVNLKKLPPPINQEGSNYAPLKKDSNFYFTSSRPVNVTGKKHAIGNANVSVKKKETPFLNTVYLVRGNSPGNEHSSDGLSKLDFDISEKENAAVAISPNGNTMYFTAWNGTAENKTTQIYSALKKDSKWQKPESAGLQVNIKGFSAMQPHVTSDGKYLIFSSDRPGGYGKYDLWYTPIRPDGTLGQAVNMGSIINTEADEQAAYYNPKTQKLLFSSNGRVGLGGFDFFESDGAFAGWTEPLNLGFPFNSSKDDLYFTAIDANGDEGYISSDRESVCCLELFHVKKEYFTIKGTIIDCETNEPLNGANVSLSDSSANNAIVLDASGEYTFRLNNPRPLTLVAEKEGYFTKTISYSYEDLARSDTLLNPGICLTPLVINKPITLSNIHYGFNSAELNDTSKYSLDKLVKILKDNPGISVELSAHTDNIGTDEYNLHLSQQRAQSCVDYLISEGIASNRISAKGYGESMPVVPNTIKGKDHPEGRQLNRRTEFKVIKN